MRASLSPACGQLSHDDFRGVRVTPEMIYELLPTISSITTTITLINNKTRGDLFTTTPNIRCKVFKCVLHVFFLTRYVFGCVNKIWTRRSEECAARCDEVSKNACIHRRRVLSNCHAWLFRSKLLCRRWMGSGRGEIFFGVRRACTYLSHLAPRCAGHFRSPGTKPPPKREWFNQITNVLRGFHSISEILDVRWAQLEHPVSPAQ